MNDIAAAQYAISADGTRIAYWRTGTGPALIVVTGAFNDHATGSDLVDVLSADFTVLTYDRRGRGASGDAETYAVDREIEDIAALIDAAGGEAAALGFSSGAALTLMAAGAELALSRVIAMDVPWAASQPRPAPDVADRIGQLVTEARRGEAVELFQREYVGMPEDVIVQLREAPFRPGLEAMAHTLVYDATIMGDLSVPEGLLPRIAQPALLLYGENSPPFMAETAARVAGKVADGRHREVAGIGHDLAPDLAPDIKGFLAS